MTRLAAVATILMFTSVALAGCVDTGTNPPGTGSAARAFALDCSLNADTAVWPDACTALSSFNPSPSKTEIDLAVNPTDPLNIVVASKDLDRTASDDCVWSVAQVTKDGGRTWKTVYVAGDKANRVPQLQAFGCVTDPIVAFDANGVFYYALQAYDQSADPGAGSVVPVPVVGGATGGSAFVLARSLDGGETFDNYLVQHIGDGNVVFHDYPRMLHNPFTGSVHTIWNGIGVGGVTPWVSSTRDGGETVDPPVQIVAADAPRGTAFESGFAIDSSGVIYVTIQKFQPNEFFLGGSEEAEVFLFRSTDDARSFEQVGSMFTFTPTPRQLPNNEFRTPSFVELAVDATNGVFQDRMYAVWTDYGSGDSDVLVATSTDGGTSWSDPVNVATDARNDQLFMRPKVAPDGTVFVLFASRAFDDDNRLLDQVLAWSDDGGATWRNVRLTSSGFDGDLGVHQDGFPFIGDYNGIDVAADGAIWTAWGDTRTGVAEIAVARLLPRT